MVQCPFRSSSANINYTTCLVVKFVFHFHQTDIFICIHVCCLIIRSVTIQSDLHNNMTLMLENLELEELRTKKAEEEMELEIRQSLVTVNKTRGSTSQT